MLDLAWLFWESHLAGLAPACYFPPQLVIMEAAGPPAGAGGVGCGERAKGFSGSWIGSPSAFHLSLYVHLTCYLHVHCATHL